MRKLATNIQTLEEYTASIKQQFRDDWFNLSDKEVDDYFNTDEVKDMIAERFEEDYNKLKSGEIIQNVFDIGCTSSVANCLIYMYE